MRPSPRNPSFAIPEDGSSAGAIVGSRAFVDVYAMALFELYDCAPFCFLKCGIDRIDIRFRRNVQGNHPIGRYVNHFSLSAEPTATPLHRRMRRLEEVAL